MGDGTTERRVEQPGARVSMILNVWPLRVRAAKERGDLIEKQAEVIEADFAEKRTQALVASSRAERAAVAMMERQDALAAAVARQRHT